MHAGGCQTRVSYANKSIKYLKQLWHCKQIFNYVGYPKDNNYSHLMSFPGKLIFFY